MDWSATVLTVGGVCVAAVAIWKVAARPLKWLWQRNIAGPLTDLLDKRIAVGNEPLLDRLDAIDEQVNLNGNGPLKRVVLGHTEKLDGLNLAVAALSAQVGAIHEDTTP